MEQFWKVVANYNGKPISVSEHLSELSAYDYYGTEIKNYPASWLLEVCNTEGLVEYAGYGQAVIDKPALTLDVSPISNPRLQCCLSYNVRDWPYSKRCQEWATFRLSKNLFAWLESLSVNISEPSVCEGCAYFVQGMVKAEKKEPTAAIKNYEVDPESGSRIGREYRAFNGHLMIYQDEKWTYNALHSDKCKCGGESLPDW